MKRVITVLALIILASCSASIFFFSTAADHAIDAAADIAAQPDSAADIIMRSRETEQHRGSLAWFGAGLLALALVALGMVYIALRGGTDFLKQWRLARKRPSVPQQRPYLPTIPQQPYREVPHMQRPSRVPELPAWSEYDER